MLKYLKRRIKFLSWWLDNSDGFVVSITLSVVYILLTSPIMVFGSPVQYLLFLLITALIVFVVVAIYGIYVDVREKWQQFKLYYPTEEEDILNKLRGYAVDYDDKEGK